MNIFFNKSSLFWKIFLAFWLAGFIILIATTYMTLHARLNNETRHHQRQLADIIGRYTAQNFEHTTGQPNPSKHFRANEFRVIGPDGNIIIDNIHNEKSGEHDTFEYQAQTGKLYQIIIPRRPPPRLGDRRFPHILGFRLTLILIASGFVSYFLSRIITQPLKKLGNQARSIVDGQLTDTVDADLLSRKDEIGSLAKDFDRSLNYISSLIDTRRTLLYDLSHELRAPLARLMAAVGLLEQKENIPPIMLKRIEDECHQMNFLIDQILNLSKFENREISRKRLNIYELITNCIDDIKFEFTNHIIKFSAENRSMDYQGDEKMLIMAFSNILRNGCQHTPKGTIIQVSIESHDGVFVIVISDNGPGVEHKDLDQIFKPFYHKHDNGSSFGLGLNIAQRVIVAHNGSIAAENKQSGGLSFKIILPI